MTWWAWVLVWAFAVLAALFVFVMIGRDLWRKGKGLLREVGTASERFSAVMEQVDALGEQAARRKDLAVFADPVALRRDREKALKDVARRKQRERDERIRLRTGRGA